MDKHKQTGGASATSSERVEKDAGSPDQSGGSPWLFLAGATLVVGGVGLTVLPVIVPAQAWITNSFAKHGVSGSPIALTGLVLWAVWSVARSRREQPAPVANVDKDLLLEQIASDMAQARGGMQDLRVEFVYLKDQVQSAATQRESQSDSNESQSALFGLAASMDQLAARLEQHMKAQNAAMQEAIGLLRHDVTETGASVAELRARIEEGMGESSEHHDAHSEYRSPGERQVEIESGYQADADDLQVFVELDETEERGLGLLDEIDDLGRHYTVKQSPSSRPVNNPPRISLDIERVTAPIPSRTDISAAGIDEKLSALRALMSDPTVREALEAARRHA